MRHWCGLRTSVIHEQALRRVRRVGEVLASIRTLKMYAWEGLFEARVAEARMREVKSLAVRCGDLRLLAFERVVARGPSLRLLFDFIAGFGH